ncbi:hypothetical protein WQE_15366 [Paraburkholderia hospita]|uniref:Uncharacterized protein n=1 Tax=Paraburkholderia hospita TaxID=169430 RepID=A0ABN0FNQ7_9BURK|nr:hypothetical protein [Paraburkholderia hospita]EIN00422.1 hypothetical protein WQE_15366 [Paraburkholderia hospita]OUL88435.1 hypothetical protein CA602_11280 [Paraburkholderia hospita]
MLATQFDASRIAFHRKIASAYHGFLSYLFIQNNGDVDLQWGLAETRNKFLSSYYIESQDTALSPWLTDEVILHYRGASRRYLVGDYYSEAAVRVLGSLSGVRDELRFEHVVPKGKGIKEACEDSFRRGAPMTAENIASLLDTSWHIAVVTKAEDTDLRTSRIMPKAPSHGVFARYQNDDGNMIFPLLRSREDGERCKEITARVTSLRA